MILNAYSQTHSGTIEESSKAWKKVQTPPSPQLGCHNESISEKRSLYELGEATLIRLNLIENNTGTMMGKPLGLHISKLGLLLMKQIGQNTP